MYSNYSFRQYIEVKTTAFLIAASEEAQRTGVYPDWAKERFTPFIDFIEDLRRFYFIITAKPMNLKKDGA